MSRADKMNNREIEDRIFVKERVVNNLLDIIISKQEQVKRELKDIDRLKRKIK